VADSADGALEHPPGLREPEPVQERDRPRAHGDHVAEDPAYARRRSLEWLHGRRVVVALDLERGRLAAAEVEHTRVLARALEHPRAARRQPLQERRRVLVAAVLGPEQREDGELEVVRLALEQLDDPLELVVGEAERAVERLFGDARQGDDTRDRAGRSRPPWKARAPSVVTVET
jgi:hypothetical protein